MLASGSPRRAHLLNTLGLTFTVIVPPNDAEPEPLPSESPALYALRAACLKACSLLPTLNEQKNRVAQQQLIHSFSSPLSPSTPAPTSAPMPTPASAPTPAGMPNQKGIFTQSPTLQSFSSPNTTFQDTEFTLPNLTTVKHAILAADTIVTLGTTIFGKPKNKEDALHMLKSLTGKTHTVYTGYCLLTPFGSEAKSVATQVTFWDVPEQDLLNYISTGEPFDKAGSYGIQDKGAFLAQSINGSYTNIVGLPLAEVVQSLLKLTIIT